MTLHHLQYLLAVARTGSFSRAAEEMHVTQPTVSAGIGELEKGLGVRLFNRSGRQVSLTMEGRTLVKYGMQVQDLVDEATHHLNRRDVLPGEGFQFGAIDAAVTYLLPDILKDYMRDYPEVSLSVQVEPTRYLVEDLLWNRSEFAVISLPFEHERLETVSIYRDSMPLVVGANHGFAKRKRVTLAEVVKEPLILFHADSVSRKVVDERFAEAGVSPGVVMEMRSPEAMRKLVEVGVGISFLPHLAVQESLESELLTEVKVAGISFSREIGVAWRRGRYFGPAIRYLLEAIFEAYGGKEKWEKSQGNTSG
ncbi:MAG: LysR family transcriptional regulator [bacterium]|nr:LysR family transcriptional regulator [bacterium]